MKGRSAAAHFSSSLPVRHKEGKRRAVGHPARGEEMAQHAHASTLGTCRVPLCQIIVLAEVQGEGSGGGSVSHATACSNGRLPPRSSPLVLPSPLKPILRSQSHSSVCVGWEVRSRGEMLLCQASSLQCRSEVTCRGPGTTQSPVLPALSALVCACVAGLQVRCGCDGGFCGA